MRHYEENVLTSRKAHFILADINNTGSSYAREIAETYDLHRPTVSEILNALEEEGVVRVDESVKKPGKHFEIDQVGLVDIFVELWAEEYDLELEENSLVEFIEKRYSQLEDELKEGFEKATADIDVEERKT